MSDANSCPSCRQPMHAQRFDASDGRAIDLDLCFGCQGLWFDPRENSRLTPRAVLQLFELLHQHLADGHRPVAQQLHCPRCRAALERGYDVAQGGRYVTYRCAQRHGRFSTFGSFLVEKGFVRHLRDSEIETLARRVGTIACTHCGGSVDLRQDHACPWCRSALALLDPDAVAHALERYGDAMRAANAARRPDALADALVSVERQNAREQRERQRQRLQGDGDSFDLLGAGIELVWSLLRR